MVTTTAAVADIERLEQRTSVRDRDEVVPFLTQNPAVVALLLEALDRIPSFFAPDTPLVLDMVHDHEDENDPGDLLAIIRTTLEPNHAMPLFDRFADEWWREASARVTNRFAFSLEYV